MTGHDHSHHHGAHGHVHGSGNERAVGLAAVLTGAFMLTEVIGGALSGSLALLADAGPGRVRTPIDHVTLGV